MFHSYQYSVDLVSLSHDHHDDDPIDDHPAKLFTHRHP